MSIMTKFELKAKDATGQELLDFLNNIIKDTKNYSGCQGADFGQAEEADDVILLIEKWQSKQHFEDYLNWRIRTGDFAQLGSLLQQQPSVQHFIIH